MIMGRKTTLHHRAPGLNWTASCDLLSSDGLVSTDTMSSSAVLRGLLIITQRWEVLENSRTNDARLPGKAVSVVNLSTTTRR